MTLSRRSALAPGLWWIDRFIVRPHIIRRLLADGDYLSRRNPWHARWCDRGLIRNRWPWRLRMEIWWFKREITIGFLYWNVERYPANSGGEPGFGVHFWLASNGWIEGVAA